MSDDREGAAFLGGRRVSLLVPAYTHPAVAPDLWRRLAEAAPLLRAVIVNPASGPGVEVDSEYSLAVERLRAAGARVVGYVDTGYGQRPLPRIEADLAAYRRWYGIRDVFFDQVAAGVDTLDHYADMVLRARAAGARFVVLNPGVPPHPGYLDLADVVVSFEGTWQDYRGAAGVGRAVPPVAGVSGTVAERLCHLVYDLPRGTGAAEAFGELLRRAEAAGVGIVFGSDGSGDNPWDTFPQGLVHDLMQGQAAPGGPAVSQRGDQRPDATGRR